MQGFIKSILVAFFLLATSIGFSQSYSISPNDTIEVNAVMDDLHTLIISQINSTSDSLFLKWAKVSSNVPAGWEISICDNQLCNTNLADSGSMKPVLAGEYGFLLIHATPHLDSSTAIVRYAVWDSITPSQRDTLTWIIHILPSTNTNKINSKKVDLIYPNPANESFYISTTNQFAASYILYDSQFRNVQTGNLDFDRTRISSIDLSSGMYFIRIQDAQAEPRFHPIIIKH